MAEDQTRANFEVQPVEDVSAMPSEPTVNNPEPSPGPTDSMDRPEPKSTGALFSTETVGQPSPTSQISVEQVIKLFDLDENDPADREEIDQIKQYTPQELDDEYGHFLSDWEQMRQEMHERGDLPQDESKALSSEDKIRIVGEVSAEYFQEIEKLFSEYKDNLQKPVEEIVQKLNAQIEAGEYGAGSEKHQQHFLEELEEVHVEQQLEKEAQEQGLTPEELPEEQKKSIKEKARKLFLGIGAEIGNSFIEGLKASDANVLIDMFFKGIMSYASRGGMMSRSGEVYGDGDKIKTTDIKGKWKDEPETFVKFLHLVAAYNQKDRVLTLSAYPEDLTRYDMGAGASAAEKVSLNDRQTALELIRNLRKQSDRQQQIDALVYSAVIHSFTGKPPENQELDMKEVYKVLDEFAGEINEEMKRQGVT